LQFSLAATDAPSSSVAAGGLGRDVRRPAPADEIVNICMPSRHSDTGRPSSLTKTCAPTAAYGFEGSNCRAEGASHSNCSCTKMPAPSLHKIKRYSVVPQLQVVVADNRSLAEPKRILVHAAACDDACPDYRQEEAETIKDLKALVRPTWIQPQPDAATKSNPWSVYFQAKPNR